MLIAIHLKKNPKGPKKSNPKIKSKNQIQKKLNICLAKKKIQNSKINPKKKEEGRNLI